MPQNGDRIILSEDSSPNKEQIPHEDYFRFSIQGGPSGHGTQFVDIQLKVPPLLIQK